MNCLNTFTLYAHQSVLLYRGPRRDQVPDAMYHGLNTGMQARTATKERHKESVREPHLLSARLKERGRWSSLTPPRSRSGNTTPILAGHVLVLCSLKLAFAMASITMSAVHCFISFSFRRQEEFGGQGGHVRLGKRFTVYCETLTTS